MKNTNNVTLKTGTYFLKNDINSGVGFFLNFDNRLSHFPNILHVPGWLSGVVHPEELCSNRITETVNTENNIK